MLIEAAKKMEHRHKGITENVMERVTMKTAPVVKKGRTTKVARFQEPPQKVVPPT